jgi:hypothetical protein
VAAALGWPTDRVASALQAAEDYPDITGPVILQHAEADAYIMTARLDRLSAAQRQALNNASGSCDPLGPTPVDTEKAH